jgi:hypothetical protein
MGMVLSVQTASTITRQSWARAMAQISGTWRFQTVLEVSPWTMVRTAGRSRRMASRIRSGCAVSVSPASSTATSPPQRVAISARRRLK